MRVRRDVGIPGFGGGRCEVAGFRTLTDTLTTIGRGTFSASGKYVTSLKYARSGRSRSCPDTRGITVSYLLNGVYSRN